MPEDAQEADDGAVQDFWSLTEEEREALRALDPFQQEDESVKVVSSEGVEEVLTP
jgi:hypothetical protein